VCNFSFPRACLLARVLQALLVASAAGWLYGCGAQGPPRPPRLERPGTITDLSIVQVGQALEVHFSIPQQTSDGERLTKPLEVEILRVVAAQGKGLSKLPEPEVWIRLIQNEWLPYAQGGEVSYSAHLTEQEFRTWRGQTLVLAVRTLTRGFRHRALESDPSNRVDVPIFDVSEPVGGVAGVTTEKALEVRFAPPAKMLSGQPLQGLAGYRIYRSNTGARGSFEMIGETSAPPYRDSQFEFGRTYYYRVRAVFGEPGHWAVSDDSQLAKITPRDTFPPAAPQGLTGMYAADGVELVWTANLESDMAGYNVYRLENPPPQRLNGVLLRTPVFRDTTAAPGKTLRYYVTAVDLAGNESRPSETVEVETR
jgi:hypothetical protein